MDIVGSLKLNQKQCWSKSDAQAKQLAVCFDLENYNFYTIGGSDIIVEINESKFGKRKYDRGHRVAEKRIVGGVKRTKERRMLAVTVDIKDANTSKDIIGKNVHHLHR